MQRTERILPATIVVAATAIVASIGAVQAASGARVLGFLDLPFTLLRTSGAELIRLCLASSAWIAALVSTAAVALAVAAAQKGKDHARPFVLMAAAVSLVTSGEAALLADAIAPGLALYTLGFTCAVFWGSSQPLPKRATPPARSPSESAIFVGLMMWALLTRTYALTELPHEFESEMAISMLATHTLAGVRQYGLWGITSNTNGIAHLLPQWMSFQLFEDPVYALRFVSVVCGLVTTAIFYSLTRRLGGRRAAVVATVLFIAAPDQLFWSREENTPFQFVALLAVITANVGVRMVERLNVRTVLVAALWMPLARLFYGPAMVMVAYPILLYFHSLLVAGVRASWRSARYTRPLLAAGVALWVVSLSAAYFAFSGGAWRFINPTLSAGAPVWRGEGTFREASALELVQLQVTNLAKNTATVATSAAYRGGFSNWYRRADASSHPTTVNVAVVVLLTIGIGYLLGQLRDRCAFALLAWFALGMLPTLLSVDPVPRRMVGAFPAFYAIIALVLAAVVAQLRSSFTPMVARCASGALAAAVALIAWTTMASYFLLPMMPTFLDPLFRSSKPVFSGSDAIYYNVGPDWALLLAFGHTQELFGSRPTPCYEQVPSRAWLRTMLTLPCSFASPALSYTLREDQQRALKASYDPQHISLLLRDDPAVRRDLRLLQALLPSSAVNPLSPGSEVSTRFAWMRTDRAAIETLRAPTLHAGSSARDRADLPSSILAGVNLRDGEPPAGAEDIRIDGSVLIDRSGWYKFKFEPACEQAQLNVGGQATSTDEWSPLPSGAHAFTLQVPTASACTLPLQLTAVRYESSRTVPVPVPPLVAASVAALPEARANRVARISGYREEALGIDVKGTPLDIVAEASGDLTILVEDTGTFRITRISSAGRQETSWTLPRATHEQSAQAAPAPVESSAPAASRNPLARWLDRFLNFLKSLVGYGRHAPPPTLTSPPPPLGLSRAPDGTLFAAYPGGKVVLYNRDGTLLDTWEGAPVRTTALGHLADGSILSALPERNAIVVLDRHGHEMQSWSGFEGGPSTFFEPSSVGVDKEGHILVIQATGGALLFQTPIDHFAPRFVSEFYFDFAEPSVQSTGWVFDETRGQILIPDSTSRNIIASNLGGDRVMASDPSRDLNQQGLDVVRRVAATADALYTLDVLHHLRKFRPLDAD